jgi:two-component system chemotaxis response regulator CheY
VARILIVDDAAVMRNMLRNMLAEFGHEVVAEAGTGLEAIKAYEEKKPDLVTLDITMPEMDGIEAVGRIMIIDPKAKIIMCSAIEQQEMIIEAIQAGASDFVVKPFLKERIRNSILTVLG